MTENEVKLPELPAHKGFLLLHNTGGVSQVWGYTADQLRAYATEAVRMNHAAGGEAVAKNKWAPPYPDAAKDPFNSLLTTHPAADALGVVREWGGFIEGRYPYTYAYDLLREMNPLRGDNSRAEMAAFVTEHCAKRGIEKEKFCCQLADIHIRYEQAVDRAGAARITELEAALGQGKADG